MIDKKRIENAVNEILIAISEDPKRSGLIETPKRVANMLEEIFAGISKNPFDDIKLFDEGYSNEMVIIKDIPLYSVCEHHLMPFFGVAHIAYIPSEEGKILGLSKIARVLDTISKKPQLQERLCSQFAEVIEKATNAKGVCVIAEAEHLCMTMRGIRKPGAKTVTSVFRGCLETDAQLKNEALSLITMREGKR